jgi:outer membrane protein OmpA-like peptidoglycan-associated protein
MNPTTWHRIKSGTAILLPFGLLFLFLTGCGLSRKEMMAQDQMERARKAYAEAKASPSVEAYAPIELQEAGKALQAAEQAEKAKETDEILQLGYLAERKTQFAVTTTEGKVAEREIDKLNVQNAEMIARKRTLEAERARLAAGKAMSEAEKARMAAAIDAEKAAMAKRETEQARMAAAADAERAAIAKRQAEQAISAAEEEAAKAARAKAEADELMRELSELKAQQTERGIVLTIGDVLFATDKADLSPSASKSVNKLADFLKKYRNRDVLIEGHTDSVGTDDYNLTLSRKRADSVKYKLMGDGIEEGRITTVGYGERFPLASNDTKAGKAQNRRVEVIILNEGVKADTQFRK